jgi:arylsulfatase A-like enzyme
LVLSRRHFLGSCASAAFAAGRRPNVLVFMTDQESALLPGPVHLPARAILEKTAVRFTHAFCNTPQCSPARSSLLTGLEPHRTGVLTNVDSNSLGKPLPLTLPTIGSVFQKAGYATGYFGKWHLGNQKQGLEQYGFSEFGEGHDNDVARKAAAWVKAQRGPWLAWVSVLNPHNIYRLPHMLRRVKPRRGVLPPVSTLANLAGKPTEQQEYADHDQGEATEKFSSDDWVRYRSYYCELVEKADANLGTVLAALPDAGNTVVAYTSDHGDALGEHGLPFKGPFMYEEEIRVPLLISAPRGVGLPFRADDLITQASIAPMLAQVAGVEWPRRPSPPGDAVFLEYYAKQKWVNPIRTIRTNRWKLNWYDSGHKELYDLSSDQHELVNHAGEDSGRAVQTKLEARLDAWRPAWGREMTTEVN